ncbi:MAG: BatD family protein [Candidatus Marinarcus sp.]|uniref:BatD family protein n=1 Tax=Candidatus Marinarcus sp. TaxID=3100987 RepID=UPI003B00D001
MIIKWLLFFSVVLSCLHADVKMDAPKSFTSGEALVFSIVANGETVTFPKIDSIDGFVVQNSNTSKNISIINAQRTQRIEKQFLLFPNKDITIPSFKITIDGKDYFTQEKHIAMRKAVKTHDDNFDFTLLSNKQRLYTGQSALLTFKFKHKNTQQILDMALNTPDFSNFWVKQIGKAQKVEEGNFTTDILKYVVFPQKSGVLVIPPASISVTLLDESVNRYSFFGTPTKIDKIYSNELKFEVKPLPEGVSVVGDFTMNDELSHTKVNAGDALSYNVEIKGCGNIDDIKEFKLNIPNATIYDNPAQKSFDFVNNEYCGSYKKTFSIVANEDYEISSLLFSYFDLKTKRVKTVKTKAHKVNVHANTQKSVTLEKQPKVEPKSGQIKEQVVIDKRSNIFFFLYGILFSIFLFFVVKFISNKRKPKKEIEKPLSKKIKECKSTQALLKLLIPYVNINNSLDDIIFELEKKRDVDVKIKKKEIIKIIESLNYKG